MSFLFQASPVVRPLSSAKRVVRLFSFINDKPLGYRPRPRASLTRSAASLDEPYLRRIEISRRAVDAADANNRWLPGEPGAPQLYHSRVG